MASEKTQADSIRAYLTGAGSDGGAQADPDAALGNYRSSTLATFIGQTLTNPISNVTIVYVSAACGVGDHVLAATGASELKFTPAGGTQGTGVTIANGETKIIVAGGSDHDKYVRVTRTSADALSGSVTIAAVNSVNNVIGLDNVTSAEASAGDDEYRAICIKNESANPTPAIKVYIGILGTQVTSDVAQLAASGADTIETTGDLSAWPDQGWAHVRDSGGTTRETVYYTSRTGAILTVPAAGRGRLGTSATAGAASDTVDSVPGIRLAKEAPTGDASTGNAQTIADEDTAPTGRTWNAQLTAALGISIGTLAAGEIYFLWIHREIPASAVADALATTKFHVEFDAV